MKKKWIILAVIVITLIVISMSCREKTYEELYSEAEYQGNGVMKVHEDEETYNSDDLQVDNGSGGAN